MEGDPSVAAAQPPAAAAAAAADQVMLQNLRRLFQSSAETFTPLPAGAMADQSHGNAPFEAMRHAADLTPRVGCHQSPQYEIPRRPHPSGQPSHSADTSVQRTPPTPVEVSAPSAARFLQPQLAEMMHVFSSAPQPTFPAAPTTPQPPHTHMLLGTGETQQPQQPGLHQQYQQELFAQIFQQQQQLGAGYHGLVTRDRHSGGTPGGSVSAAESSIPTAYQYYGDYSGIRPQSQAGSSPPMVQKSSMPVGAEMSPFQLEAAPQQQLAQACMQPGVASPESSTSAHGLPILVLCEARGCGALLEVDAPAYAIQQITGMESFVVSCGSCSSLLRIHLDQAAINGLREPSRMPLSYQTPALVAGKPLQYARGTKLTPPKQTGSGSHPEAELSCLGGSVAPSAGQQAQNPVRRLFPPALKRGRKPADMKLLVSQQEDELRSSSKLRKVLSTKTGRKEKKDKSSRTPSPYNIFMREEICRIKAGDAGVVHKEAFKMAAKNWKEFAKRAREGTAPFSAKGLSCGDLCDADDELLITGEPSTDLSPNEPLSSVQLLRGLTHQPGASPGSVFTPEVQDEPPQLISVPLGTPGREFPAGSAEDKGRFERFCESHGESAEPGSDIVLSPADDSTPDKPQEAAVMDSSLSTAAQQDGGHGSCADPQPDFNDGYLSEVDVSGNDDSCGGKGGATEPEGCAANHHGEESSGCRRVDNGSCGDMSK